VAGALRMATIGGLQDALSCVLTSGRDARAGAGVVGLRVSRYVRVMRVGAAGAGCVACRVDAGVRDRGPLLLGCRWWAVTSGSVVP